MQIFPENAKVIELGGGARPHFRPNVDVRQCYDDQQRPTVDFTADFDQPLPISSDEWDGVFTHYVLEHVSWRRVRQFLSECFRILKPGGRAVFVTADTEAQVEWLKHNPIGWDGKDFFDSASCIIFGDNDYPENCHRNYLNHTIASDLLREAGFLDIVIQPWGARHTDMMLIATKPEYKTNVLGSNVAPLVKEIDAPIILETKPLSFMSTSEGRLQAFSKEYFNGGGKVGGYIGEGYRDFPVHEVTFRRVMDKKPTSVMELGCARGYILKRLQDAGVRANGLEISRNCWLGRVCDGIINKDICETPWPWKNKEFDLAFSMSVLEHIPEDYLSNVFMELERTTSRGLHGVGFDHNDSDKTRCTIRPQQWWQERMPPGHEVVDVRVLSDMDEFPRQILKSDGKVKLNLGCFNVMFYGWVNIDNHPNPQMLQNFAAFNGYQFLHHDILNGLPQFGTGSVDMIYTSHFLEHVSYQEGLKVLRECRRVLKPDTGVIRIIVPDAAKLIQDFSLNCLHEYNEINDGVENAPTELMKLWAMLLDNHKAMYDVDTLSHLLRDSGFVPIPSRFRDMGVVNTHQHTSNFLQIQRECLDMFPSHSLYMNAFAAVG